jgi:hypothetical protein
MKLIFLLYLLILFSETSLFSEDGVVSIGNLNWMKCNAGESTDCTGEAIRLEWKDAIEYCNKLSLGKKKWRLPRLHELRSLITCTGNEVPEYRTRCGKENKIKPTISIDLFPSTQKGLYWSSDPRKNDNYYAEFVDFKDGFSNYNAITAKSLVRCVSQ